MVALVAAAAVAALLSLRTLASRRGGSETLDFRGPVHGVEVTVASGQVTVRGGSRRDARVRRTTHTFRRPKVAEAVDDGVLRLEAPTGVVSYEVDVPARATVTVRGDTASATVINVAGAVQLRAGTGTLEGRGLACPAVRAVTSAGSIRLSFDQAPAVVDVTTGNGSVDLLLPEGDTDIRTEASGPVRVRHR